MRDFDVEYEQQFANYRTLDVDIYNTPRNTIKKKMEKAKDEQIQDNAKLDNELAKQNRRNIKDKIKSDKNTSNEPNDNDLEATEANTKQNNQVNDTTPLVKKSQER